MRNSASATNNRVKALRQLLTWATSPEYAYAKKNPARDVGRLRSNNPDGIRAWSDSDAARYEARHPIGTKARLAFDLLLYTGVRRSDVVRLGPQMERWFPETSPDGNTLELQKLVFTETKGRSRIIKTHELPILPPLRQSIDATLTGHLVLPGDGIWKAALGQGVWQLVQKAVPRSRARGAQRAWATQAWGAALRRSRRHRTSADGAVWLDQPAAGCCVYQEGEPRQTRKPGSAVAAGAKPQQ